MTAPKHPILIVEDDEAFAGLLAYHLRRQGHEVFMAGDGKETDAILLKHPIDMVLLDLGLPDISGLELLQRIRKTSSMMELPVIVVTGETQSDSLIEAFRLGANDYVPKPLDFSTCLARVQTHLSLKRAQEALREACDEMEQRVHERTRELEAAKEDLEAEVNERRRAEEALRRSDVKTRAILDAIPDLFFIVSRQGVFLDYESHNKPLMSPPSEFLGRNLSEVLPPTVARPALESLKKAFETGQVQTYEYQLAIGGKIISEETRMVVFDKDKALIITRDISARKQAEASLLQREEQLRQMSQEYQRIFNSIPATIWYKNTTNRFLRVNQATADFMGLRVDEIEGRTAAELFPREAQKYYQDDLEVIQSGNSKLGIIEQAHTARGELKWIRSDKVPIKDDQGNVTGLIAFSIDITDRKKAEETLRITQEQLLQAQKMESIGRLAGGVAHDFNNLLTAINGYAELMTMQLIPLDPLYSSAREIKKAGERAASLTRQLLAFSRKQVLQPTVLDLNSLVNNNLKMLKRLIGEDIELVTILQPDLGSIKADPVQMEQVIMNLAVNARDAMPGGGRLTIETSNVVLDEQAAWRHDSVRPGDYVLLAISDTGCGMDAEILSHIFEPFFTTKEQGKGTGLGLSTVYGIIRQSGGNLWAYSAEGMGTTFKIHLPMSRNATIQPEVSSRRAESPTGQETVLVVEDDEAVRQFACQILRTRGYQVLEATDCHGAVDLCQDHPGSIHLLLTDVVMPQMNGRNLSQRLSSLRPAMKTLYMSGHPDDAIIQHGILDPGVQYLQKPFSPDALAFKVREILDLNGSRGNS